MGRNLWKSRYLLPLCGKLKYLKNLGPRNFKLTWHDFTMFDFQVAFMVVSLVWKATGSCRVRETIRSCLWTEASGGVRLKTSSYSALDPQKALQKNMSTNQSCEMPQWLPFSFNPCQPPFTPTLLERCLGLLQLVALCLWSIFFLLLRFSYFLGIILAWRQDNKMHCTTVP